MRMFGLKFRSLKLNISKLKWYFRWCFFVVGVDRLVSSFPQLFRRTLVHMFESQDLDCVFMEAHIYPRKQKHMVLECIPLPRELGDMAPIYFKVFMCSGISLCEYIWRCIKQPFDYLQKAIMECDEEWAMNKKVVDLSSKDIRQSVCPFCNS